MNFFTNARKIFHNRIPTRKIQSFKQVLHNLNQAKLMNQTISIHYKDKSINFSLANVAGHLSYALLLLSYMESETLQLRLLAIGGFSSMSVFQYFRPKPLWLPLKWNALFILINAHMINNILQARRLSNLSVAQKTAYYYIFEPCGMPLEQFKILIDAASLQTVEKDHILTKQHERNEALFLIAEGEVDVYVEERKECSLTRHQFIGEMGLMTFLSKHTKEVMATADTKAASELTFFKWEYTTLADLCQKHPLLEHYIKSSFSNDLMWKLISKNDIPEVIFDYKTMLNESLIDGCLKESDRLELQNYRQLHAIEFGVHETLLKSIGWTNESFSLGYQS